ncbi:Cytochrome P450 71D7 [Acorus calamus]|uniref:Cytochrome P450 71D7 n=1 Tax=Acorus calamus TaxID=4465 RepID=A0AAV9F0H5_ACOCL|nr:Cytochrome P450 71D7 [Acorus calamus]
MPFKSDGYIPCWVTTLQSVSRHQWQSRVSLHSLSLNTLVVSSPEMAKQVMKMQDHIFANRPKINMMDKMCYG